MKLYGVLIVAILMVGVITCSNDNNPVGTMSSNFVNDSTKVVTMDEIYTYQEKIGNLARNDKLLMGNYNGIESRILMRFISLPDTTDLDKVEIRLHIRNQNNFGEMEGKNITLGELDKNIFQDNFATWYQFGQNESNRWDTKGGDIKNEYDIVFHTENDTITNETLFKIPIEPQIVKNWVKNGSSQNFGVILYLKEEEDKFIEFYAIEHIISSRRPSISFSYSDEEKETITRIASSDTFIYSYDITEEERNRNSIIFSNIYPTSIYTKFEIPYTLFDHIENESDLSKINILSARIVFTVEDSMMTNQNFSISPAIPREKPDLLITSEDLSQVTLYAGTSDKVIDSKISINITMPVQHIISGYRENTGICLINNQINMDFSFIKVNTEPEITIKYSVPKI